MHDLFFHHAGQIFLELFDQPLVAGPAVFLGKLIGILGYQVSTYAVKLPAHSGKLYQDFRTVRTAFHHGSYQLDMTDGPCHAVGNIVGVVSGFLIYIIQDITIPHFNNGIVAPRRAYRNPGGGI